MVSEVKLGENDGKDIEETVVKGYLDAAGMGRWIWDVEILDYTLGIVWRYVDRAVLQRHDRIDM
jgi:hypothetical protein